MITLFILVNMEIKLIYRSIYHSNWPIASAIYINYSYNMGIQQDHILNRAIIPKVFRREYVIIM